MLLAMVLVFLGGAAGSMWRYWWSGLIAQRFGETFPFWNAGGQYRGFRPGGRLFGSGDPRFEQSARRCTSAVTGDRGLRGINHFFII